MSIAANLIMVSVVNELYTIGSRHALSISPTGLESDPLAMRVTHFAPVLPLATAALAANLTLVKDYSGSTFFDDWDFYGDSPTNANDQPWDGINPWDDYTLGEWISSRATSLTQFVA